MTDIETTARKAEALRALHSGPGMLVLPNAWDAGSARIVVKAGFPAVATTSAGVANSLGFEDHQGAPLDEMLAAAARVVAAVEVPVTVDFERGYSLSSAEMVERLIAIGAVGLNYEDTDHTNGGLVDAAEQAAALAAIKAAGRAAGVDLVLNARVDVFIGHAADPGSYLEDGLRRAHLYKDAGADCVYPITLGDAAMLRQFVEAVGIVNINLRPGGPLSLAQVAALGVRRVSYAAGIYREAMTATERLVTDLASEAGALG